ncbi:5'-nucleotidase C-terminal domain-containing protein [Paraglaciecola sp. 25GB23A]|uniref:bifunctional metallophosphatase/5'-nucleotidase n=1 Tax=Paraglaciecola sp. 25GB23A TaxID=3156068 RepID=UPI0032AF6292
MFTTFRWLGALIFISVSSFAWGSPAPINKISLVFAANMPEISSSNAMSYAKLASLLALSRQEDEYTVFVFGGGSLGPSPLSSLDRGSHIIDILNTLEPDMMAISKREFSYYEDELTLRSYEAAFPFISTNLFDPLTKGNLEGVNTNLLIEKGGIKIGFISILDEAVVQEYLLQRVKVEEPKELINQQIKQLKRQGADLIVLIYSQEKDYYPELLAAKKINFALRLSSAEDLQSEAKESLNIFTVANKHPVRQLSLSWPVDSPAELQIEDNDIVPLSLLDDSKMVLLIDEYKRRLNRLLNQSIGQLTEPMQTLRELVRTQEIAFGNFIADSLKEATNADIAIINSGVIRGDKNYQADSIITRADIVRELPFRSHVAVVTITGQQLLLALENGVSEVEFAKGRFPQVAGITFTYKAKHPFGSRIQSILINGQVLQPTKQYVLATTDYLVQGGDGYTTLSMTQNKSITTQDTPLLSDIVIRAIQTKQRIAPKVEGRIVRIDQ